MTAQELTVFASFGLLSRKPALVVVNFDADRASAAPAPSSIEAAAAHGMELFGLAAAFEAELWELDPEGQREMLSAAGLSAPARDRLVTALYRRARPDHVLHRGRARGACLAAGARRLRARGGRPYPQRHRARLYPRRDRELRGFRAAQSDAKVSEAGKLRLEGKEYVIRDGDIIHVRFKV